jgi:FixJ family two-component response regulator
MQIDQPSTVFIVDDDWIGVEPLRILLRGHLGVDAVVYDRPELFVAAFDPSRPGCLLLDLAMPEPSGPDVLLELARRTSLPPTILITSHGLSSSLSHALRAGAIDYFIKPVDPERLVDSVRGALDLDRRRRRVPRLAARGRFPQASAPGRRPSGKDQASGELAVGIPTAPAIFSPVERS